MSTGSPWLTVLGVLLALVRQLTFENQGKQPDQQMSVLPPAALVSMQTLLRIQPQAHYAQLKPHTAQYGIVSNPPASAAAVVFRPTSLNTWEKPARLFE